MTIKIRLCWQYCLLCRIGFPLKDLSRAYKEKIKNMIEGGYKIKFSSKVATQVVNKTIFYYFIKNDRVHFL